ncbi:hypothetical protein Sta7437_1073 [Stanieria cyanosphaera PCC 7437]|uniref:Uncharacterized protein n=1 Tax=Stanieria cyanosphaera (strain ATCC 29371 / PCC 7437) TaxID=111780 RepID=K9XPV4_STAC7|nr:hypothetical protein [Stanieria cyanosphaera]AFZ34650.1 hypothetical protein Sta7437_1073 [Stanieria cyanosphaera PCC 7437]
MAGLTYAQLFGTNAYAQNTLEIPTGLYCLYNENPDRKGLVINNMTSNGQIYLGLNDSVSPGEYLVVIPPDASYSFDFAYTGEIWTYTTDENNTIKATEFGEGDGFNPNWTLPEQ